MPSKNTGPAPIRERRFLGLWKTFGGVGPPEVALARFASIPGRVLPAAAAWIVATRTIGKEGKSPTTWWLARFLNQLEFEGGAREEDGPALRRALLRAEQLEPSTRRRKGAAEAVAARVAREGDEELARQRRAAHEDLVDGVHDTGGPRVLISIDRLLWGRLRGMSVRRDRGMRALVDEALMRWLEDGE